MFFSPSTRGFYSNALHGNNMPEDVVEITSTEHRTLLAAQSQGKRIEPDESGKPIAVTPPLPEPPKKTMLGSLRSMFSKKA